MSSQLVTVFGGSGFVGRNTVRELARAGYRVRVAVRRPHTAHFLRPMGDVGQIELVQANIRDDNSVLAAVEGADIVINLVGILFARGKQSFLQVQAAGAGRVARLARQAGVKTLVHVSAIGASITSTARYARSKGEGEDNVRKAFPEAIILRPSIIFGPEDEFFNLFAGLAKISPVLPLIGGGKTRFQPVYVDDVADAIVAAIRSPSAAGRIYELGGPAIYSFRELLTYILEITGRRRLLVPVPFGLAKFQAFFFSLMPRPLLTPDQVELLKYDNVVGSDGDPAIGTIEDFGITLETVEAIVPTYLYRHRPHGQYEAMNI